jgi:TonB family protein
VVPVSVTIDRNGRVPSRRVVGSSGSSTLDRAAFDMVQRAAISAFLLACRRRNKWSKSFRCTCGRNRHHLVFGKARVRKRRAS